MNNNNSNNSNNSNNNTSGYRTIVPAPSPSTKISPMIPISPHHSPQARPNPQHGILPPPFRTPPVSPFSHPMNMNPEYLPPPLQPLPPMMSMTTPPSPTNGRYERILPKQQTPSTSVFSVPMTPSNASSVMQHHNSVIHPPYQQHRVSLSGAATGTNGDKQLTTADQRELARKVSHSAIERRRRERINDKIMQLKELIPSCADQDHLHKLSILQSAIEYIQYLQGCVAESRKREGNNNGNSEERFAKRSKFDRYEIPFPKHINDNNSDKSEYKRKNSSEKSSGSDSENGVTSTSTKKETTDASTNTDTDAKSSEDVNHEEANALLLLSKSTSTTTTTTNNNNNNNNDDDDNNSNNNNKEIPKTRDVEIQTSPNMDETIEIEDEEKEKEQKEEPRRGITVQQLLCN